MREAESHTHGLLRTGAEPAEGLLAQMLMICRDVELVEDDGMLPALRQPLEKPRVGIRFAVGAC